MGSENHSAIFCRILQLHSNQKILNFVLVIKKTKIHLCYHAFPYFCLYMIVPLIVTVLQL